MTALVLIAALAPGDPSPHLFVGHDKAQHVGAFAALGAAYGWRATRRGFWISGFALAGLAVGIEILQGLCTSTRDPSVFDAAASALGAALGLWAAHAMNARAPRRAP
ncbi:MAG: hypothetical protein AB7L65_08070 [Hyphomonadaceae bacterium]